MLNTFSTGGSSSFISMISFFDSVDNTLCMCRRLLTELISRKKPFSFKIKNEESHSLHDGVKWMFHVLSPLSIYFIYA